MGINFTCMSYCDGMDFGIVVEPDLVPNHDAIAEKLQEAFTLYLGLCTPRKKPAAKAPRKKAVTKRAKK
jgi:hypothetical protein